MSKVDFIWVFIILMAVFLSLFCVVGVLAVKQSYGILSKCAKENNVYECEFIAVPKKEKGSE